MVRILFISLMLIGCTRREPSPAAPPDTSAAHGKQIYAITCTACHNPDPTKDGSLGPAIAGSSLELIERRVMFGDYPAGYTPKRPTKVMVKLPHLKNEIPALAAYLSSLGK